jgi:hypothetical protein
VPEYGTNRRLTFVRFARAKAAFVAMFFVAAIAQGQSNQPTLFVAHNFNNEGSVASVVFDANDHPVLADRLVTPSTNTTGIALSPSGIYLATTHATAAANEDITIIKVNPDATLTMIGVLAVLPNSTALDLTWITDEFLVVPRTSSVGGVDDALELYRFDPVALSLTLVDSISSNPSFSFLITCEPHPTLPVVYVADSPLAGSVLVYTYEVDPAGRLILLDTEFTGGFAVDIGVSNDGRRLFVPGGIGGSGNQIDAFDINPIDGTLDFNLRSPFFSIDRSPKGTTFGSNNKTLFVTHGGDGRALSYSLDPATGEPTFARLVYDAQIGFALGSTAIISDIVIVSDESTIFDNRRGVIAFRYDAAGIVSPLGPMLDTGSSGADRMATWIPEASCYADCDTSTGIGVLDIFDFLCFQDSFVRMDPYACDCDTTTGQGVCDIFDFLCFQNAFVAGCP